MIEPLFHVETKSRIKVKMKLDLSLNNFPVFEGINGS